MIKKKDLESKLESFNNLFSYVSKELYGESYLLAYEIAEYRGKIFINLVHTI